LTNKQEDFLSKTKGFLSYLMSIQVQELVPISNNLLSNQPNKQIQQIQVNIVKKIILPILKKESKKENPLSDKQISTFMKSCIKLSDIQNKHFTIKQLVDSDLNAYESITNKIKNNSVMSAHSKEESLQIIDVLKNYQKNIIPTIMKKMPLLEKTLIQIDVKDLYRSLYGSLLSFVCIGTLLDLPDLQHRRTFENIAHQGHELAKNLAGYTDTLDILTSPEKLQDGVIIKSDNEKEFIEIDFNKIGIGKYCILTYKDERYVVKRIDQDHLAFYDVK